MRAETSDLALGEHTHRRTQKDTLLGWPGCGSMKRLRNGYRNAWEKAIL